MEAIVSGTKPKHYPTALKKTTEVAPNARLNFVMSFRFYKHMIIKRAPLQAYNMNTVNVVLFSVSS